MNYAALLTEQRPDNGAYVECMRQLRGAAREAEIALGGPVRIAEKVSAHTPQSYIITFCFLRIEPEPEAPGT